MIATKPDIRIIPYTRQQDRGHVLYQAWNMVEQSGDSAALFWNMPDAPRDLTYWTEYFKSGRQLFLMVTEDSWLGLAWAEDIQPGHHAFLSFFLRPEARRGACVEAGRQMVAYVMEAYQLPRLWAMTPWRQAKQLALMTGAQCAATIPQYARIGEAVRDVWLMQWMR